MKNIMNINGYDAVINYDPEIEMFRGEFINLNGGADFYAADIKGLQEEGSTSLKVFLKMCEEDGVSPKKNYSGKLNVRISPALHEHLVRKASATGKVLSKLLWSRYRTTSVASYNKSMKTNIWEKRPATAYFDVNF